MVLSTGRSCLDAFFHPADSENLFVALMGARNAL